MEKSTIQDANQRLELAMKAANANICKILAEIGANMRADSSAALRSRDIHGIARVLASVEYGDGNNEPHEPFLAQAKAVSEWLRDGRKGLIYA